jgi:signal transduction histidine kinase
MLRKVFWTAVFAVAFAAVGFAETSEYGTAEEAKALLERAIAAVKADEAKALEAFNDKDGGFRDRDLYVFCANAADGIETAHPTHKGQKLSDIKDANGFAFGEEIMKTATEGKISEVTYMWPRPGSDTPIEKVTYVTKIGDQICAVGYYK